MKSCSHRRVGRFCPDCGFDFEPVAYNRAAFVDELIDNWWEKGVVRTLFGLFLRPGTYLRIYIEQDRKFLLRPLSYAAVIIASLYGLKSRVPGLQPVDTSESTTLTLLLSDPLVPTLLAAIIGALVITYVTHRGTRLSIYGAVVVRLYLSVQALMLMFAVEVIAAQSGLTGSWAHSIARNGLGLGWLAFALWQYFKPDQLSRAWLRAIGAVIVGEVALFLLLIIPIVVIDEMGWLA